MHKAVKITYTQISIAFLLLFLFSVSLLTIWYQSKINTEIIIARDVAMLASLFKNIDETCKIIDFKYNHNYIDFLNVIAFEGSEVGTMILQRPQQWKGPYVRENLTIQGKLYQVIKNKNGYYVVPGDGVKLQNGMVIGKDIKLNMQDDIEQMIQEQGMMNFQGKPLAARFDLQKK